jgi:transaldolase
MTTDHTHIIVGASLAGAKAAETLRDEGFDGRVVLVGAEDERPYERPPLSKDYLRGEVGREKVYVHDEGFYAEHGIELRLGRTAVNLDTSSRELTFDDGERLPYDRLLLATGAEPRRLAIPGGELDGVVYLRSVDDSDALRERLDRGGAVVVVGAGWIGAEVAASARQRGLDVTVLDPASLPLERVLGAEVGAVYRDVHTDHGVRMLLGTGVEAFEGDRTVERVRTNDGRELECDFAVVGVGVQPRIGLAVQAGIAVDNGILVDEQLQTRVPGVFAAGDVANAHHPFYGERIRVEHWANALNQGPAAALNMLGQSAAYERLPYFFSDQYELGMEYTGFARAWDRVVFRGDPAGREFVAFWLVGDRVVAGMNANVWDVTDAIQRLIRDRVAVDDKRLADTDVPLEELAPHEKRQRRMNRLQALHDAGVSIWLDTLSRDLLDSGKFATLISDCAVTGATSNPTIFAKAITGSDRYDDQLRAAVASGLRDRQQLFFELALEDIRRAADLLRPTYEESDGRDGFISFECTPDLADDTQATIEQALELWNRLARPNVMIKVPATEAGVPAIEELTARGVNVNVTLLFSLARYEQVIDAYLTGLERRVAGGEPVDAMASVASFFVSRVDAKADALLPAGSDLRGRVAIANAHRAYAWYRQRFADDRWHSLGDVGARPQRPLWASTGTKDPTYSDVLYVEELIAPEVINTMPEATLRAFADHGNVRRALSVDAASAEETLRGAEGAGIDLDAITAQLEREGVRSFCDSYHDLLECIEAKLARMVLVG